MTLEDLKGYSKELIASGAATMTAFIFGGALVAIVVLFVALALSGVFGAGLLKTFQITRIDKRAEREARSRRREWRRALRHHHG